MAERYRPRLAATVQEPSRAEAETPKKFAVGLSNREIPVDHPAQKTERLGCSSSWWPVRRRKWPKKLLSSPWRAT